MSLTEAEVEIANQALDRIHITNFTLAVQTSVQALKCNTIYTQTRNALLRSFEWPFASDRAELDIVQTLTLNVSPSPDAWAVDDVITGTSSYETATIISVTSDVEYEIAYLSGDFTDGETITNGTVSVVDWEGIPLEYEGETVLWYDESASDDATCGTGYPAVADSTPDFEWDYKFKLPSDFLRFKSDYGLDDSYEVDARFAIEGDCYLTNNDEAEIRYIKKVTDPDDFDPLFTEVLVLTLAKKLIPALAGTKSPTLLEDVGNDLKEALSHVRTVCRQETNVSGRSDWRQARHSVNTGSV